MMADVGNIVRQGIEILKELLGANWILVVGTIVAFLTYNLLKSSANLVVSILLIAAGIHCTDGDIAKSY